MKAVFAKSLVINCLMSDDRVAEFISRSKRFEYTCELGTVIGYKNDGDVILVTEIKLLMDERVKNWAEMVANCYCKFAEVPDELKPEVKALLDKLFDPNAVIPPMTHTSYSYKDGKMTRDDLRQ